ncbi:gluconokinase [Williamsia sp. Leaf354]|uniref:gluconokinase n=1 Tax=Williamsia sp. Leaf354 TaxID=1736349 RepID=UPI000B26BE8E|nr:gluconokinase [Williamsia sp. Leaf354]
MTDTRSADPIAGPHLCVMGVSGVGKTTIAQGLAEQLGRPFGDADDLHPAANIEKMANGHPLTDADRAPWLDAVVAWLDGHGDGDPTVFACSALRRAYRDRIARARAGVVFVHLTAPTDELRRRLEGRTGHYMKVTMLESQLATLEDLEPDERGVRVATAGSVDDTIDAVEKALREMVP